MSRMGRIFLLDDDELIISMLAKVLRRVGYEVYTETRTENILEKIEQCYPDVVLLDAGPRRGDRFTLPDDGISFEALEKDLIAQALERTNWNKARAGRQAPRHDLRHPQVQGEKIRSLNILRHSAVPCSTFEIQLC